MEKIKKIGSKLFGNRRYIDWILIFVAILVSILVRLGSITRDPERFKFVCFPEMTEECIDEFYDNDELPYMFEIDSYHYVKQTDDLSKGIINSSKNRPLSLLSVITVGVWGILRLFSDVSIYQVMVFIGPFIFALSCIPAYLFVKKKTNRIGGFTAGLLIGVCAPFVNYACFARFDTDILTCLLPMASIVCLILAIEGEERKKQIGWLTSSVLCFLLLAFAWGSFSIYYYVILAICLAVILVFIIKERFKIKAIVKNKKIRIAVFAPILIILVCALFGKMIAFDKVIQVFNYVFLNSYSSSVNRSIYPDGTLFVGELQTPRLLSGGWLGIFDSSNLGIINWLGGIGAVSFMVVLLIYFGIRIVKFLINKSREDKNVVTEVALVVWTIGGIIGAFSGVRFLCNAVIPVMLILGIGIGLLFEKMKTKKFGISVLCIIWLVVCLPSLRSYASFSYDVTIIDDNLKATANYIRDNFDENYIVISDWGYGYYFAYESGHNIFTDGGGGTKMRYWIYEAMASKDEKFVSGILNRLAGYTVDGRFFEGIEEKIGGELEGVKFIRRSATLNREEATKVLKDEYELGQEDTDEIISRLYSDKKVVVVTSDSMIHTGWVTMYYHCWDFEQQKSICSEEDNVETYTKERRFSAVDGNENMLKLEKSYDKDVIFSKLFDKKGEDLKQFELKKEFKDRVGINDTAVWVVK